MTEIILTKHFIELYALLKLENLAASGGEAKFFITEGKVRVNGVIETRKRKKITVGDTVELAGERLLIKGKQ